MATREVALGIDNPPATYGAGDTYVEWNHFDAPQDLYQSTQTWIGDGQAKNLGLLDSFHRFFSQVPKGSGINKSKITLTAGGSKSPPHAFMQVGLVARDGFWDAPPAGVLGYNEHLHWIMRVDQTSGPIPHTFALTTTAANGGQPPLGASIEDTGFGEAAHSFGMKWLAHEGNAPHTLDVIYCRARRDAAGAGDRSSTKLRIKVYDVISPDDPRPSGDPIAVSDDVDFLSLPTALPPNVPYQNWLAFTFSGDNRVVFDSAQPFVTKLEVDPQPTETPYFRHALNDDRQSGVDKGGTPSWNAWMVAHVPTCGFHYNHYPCHDLMDLPMFGTLDQFQFPWAYFLNTEVSFGDAGYPPPDTYTMTPSLGALIQSYIDDPEYDESGTPIGIRIHTPQATGGFVTFHSDDAESYDGMVLTINYDEPIPSKATNPSPAHLATGVSEESELSWTTGTYAGTAAVTHNVYFGTTPSLGGGDFQGNQPGNTFDPGLLYSGKKYYWRIDEVGEFETTTGDTWEFTTRMPEPPEPIAIVVIPVDPLITDPGTDLRKPATPDLVPALPDSLETEATPQLEVSPPPALVSPPGATLELVKSDEDTALETPKSSDLAETEPGVSIEANRGKLE